MPVLCTFCIGTRIVSAGSEGGKAMKRWRKPRIVEISVGTEINAYACADL